MISSLTGLAFVVKKGQGSIRKVLPNDVAPWSLCSYHLFSCFLLLHNYLSVSYDISVNRYWRRMGYGRIFEMGVTQPSLDLHLVPNHARGFFTAVELFGTLGGQRGKLYSTWRDSDFLLFYRRVGWRFGGEVCDQPVIHRASVEI